MKRWTFQHGGNTIEVTYSQTGGSTLYVNGEVQDTDTDVWSTTAHRLSGNLASGEKIKVTLGGVFVFKCSVFVDNKPLNPVPNDSVFPPPSPQPSAPVQEQKAVSAPAFCTACGKQLNADHAFCGGCGTKVVR